MPASRPQGAGEGVSSLSTPFGSVDIYSRDPAFVVAVAGCYAIQIITEHATTTTVSSMRRALADLATRHQKFGYVSVIEPEARLLIPPDIRSGFDALVRRYSPRFTGAAIIYERQGFGATAVRSLVTAINFASRATHPNHVFSDLREGVSWLCSLAPGEPGAAGLVHVLRRLRGGESTPA